MYLFLMRYALDAKYKYYMGGSRGCSYFFRINFLFSIFGIGGKRFSCSWVVGIGGLRLFVTVS